ncbi:hypothetical protein [Rhizorhabdus sp.]|uniref:hypothetical protein n=1 Tax=Rhizorhabdus sp. TaxID=1968843 RepID=UPI0019A3B33C|nr:hypothetical protein [Rhizorhabdus sp.]MBD3760293.1 hypothetical protein [Rhizorhabdus sp.]
MMLERGVLRNLLCRAGIGFAAAVPIALVFFALFYVANRASLGRDLPAAEANVRAAYAAGVLQDVDWIPGDTGIGRHQYNDCLILYMAIDQQAPAGQLAASPIKPVQRGTETMCQALRSFAGGDKAAGRTGIWYHQYIHGHTMLARWLLPVLPVETIRNLYHTLQTLLVLAGILMTMTALARRRHPTESLFWLIVFLAFSRWFGLESYGQSLGHAPSDAVILAYLLFLATGAARGGIGRRTSLIAAAIFGSLTAIFEFLTGGIPLGLAIIVGGLPFALAETAPGDVRDRVIEAAAAFCAAVVACLAFKILLALWIFGIDSFRESAAQLAVRMGVGTENSDIGPLKMAKSLAKGLNSLAAGMHVLAGAMLVTAAGFGAWGARVLLRSGNAQLRSRAIHLIASNLVIVGMLTLLWQHTIIHAWFMDRIFVWTIGSGFALFALAVMRRRTA